MTKIKILITGATGNVGMEVIRSLQLFIESFDVIAGIKDLDKEKSKLDGFNVLCKKFDFTDFATFKSALEGCESLFLLRPPQMSDVQPFKPLLAAAKEAGVQHIVFLSVQGVEKSAIIPHHKIEALIVDSKIAYTFLRPAYFMQNFTTSLYADLTKRNRIFLPAGNAKFTLVDLRDVGAVAAKVLTDHIDHINKSYDLTCEGRLTFKEMAQILSDETGAPVQYISPNLARFFWTKWKEKVPVMLILVMIMLHYFPRFQKTPLITDWVEKITGKPPFSFKQFVKEHKKILAVRV